MPDMDTEILDAVSHVSRLSRRDFLRAGSVAAGLLAAGATGLAPSVARAAVPEGIAHMSESEYAVFHRLMEVLLPTEGTKLVAPQTLPVLQTVDGAFLATLPPHVLQGLKGGVAYFNEAPKEAFGAAFVDLSDADATAFCDALASSDQVPPRALFNALKFLVVTAYWAIPPAWSGVGYDGPVFEAWGLEYAGNAPLPQT